MAMTTKRLSRSGGADGGSSKHKPLSLNDGRAKAASILLREERKSDKRQTLADALVAKLRAKYAKHDAEFADAIASMTNRLVLHTQRRLGESDIVALEAVVRKMSQERAAKRGGKSTSGGGPGVQEINASRSGSGSGQSGVAGGGGIAATSSHSKLPAQLTGQDEWVLLNALTLVEFEKDTDAERVAHQEKQRLQRTWLDAQKQEKESRKSLDKQRQQQHYEHQVTDLAKWQSIESMKKQRQQEQILQVRAERDEQLRQQKVRQQQTELQRQRDDEAELQRVRRELQKMDDDARLRRQLEHERVRALQQENAKELTIKSRAKAQEQVDDVQLMEAYAQRLEREEQMRANGGRNGQPPRSRDLVGVSHSTVATLHEQQRQRELADERRAEEYQCKRDEDARLAEQQAADKRRREALERKQFLELQRRQKKEREHEDVVEDLVYAGHVQRDTKAAIDEQKRRAHALRQRNLDEQARLLAQMAEQKQGQPMSPLHLPRTLMNSREKNINAKLLQKLDQPELAMQVLKKLSPSKEQKEYTIATSFY
jgi:hypothetical protein